MTKKGKGELEALEGHMGGPNTDPEGPETETKTEVKPKRAKAAAAATAKITDCRTMAELYAVWAALKPAERDLAAYYETGRRIAAGRIA